MACDTKITIEIKMDIGVTMRWLTFLILLLI